MKNLPYILFLLPLVSIAQLPADQKAQVDSLQQVIKTAKHDTIIVNAWIAWDNIIWRSYPEMDFVLNQKIDSLCAKNLKKKLNKQEKAKFLKSSAFALNNIGLIYKDQGDYAKAIEYCIASLKIKEEIGDKSGIAATLNKIGLIYYYQGDYAKAKDFQTKSLKIKEEIGDEIGIANSLNNIGLIYKEQGDYAKAIEYYTTSLKIKEEIGDKSKIANSLNNIGIIYYEQEDYVKAIEYYTKSLKIKEEIGDKSRISNTLNNIGMVYKEQGDYAIAMNYFTKSLEIDKGNGDKSGIAKTLINIALIYRAQGDYANALDCSNKSLNLAQEIQDKSGISGSLINIGVIYQDQGDYANALDYGKRSLAIAQEIGDVNTIINATKSLWEVYKKLNRFKESIKMYELHIVTRDSLKSEENQKAVIQQEFKYKYEKEQSLADAKHNELMHIKSEQIKTQNEKIEKERAIKYSLTIGMLIVITSIFVIFKNLRKTIKQKGVIEQQKAQVELAHDELEEKNQEIIDSIIYAKRIQSAILPPMKVVKQCLKESFIFYKPKDVVAGDFYWMEQKNGKILFAAADCTGHGVPGAMVSVVCNNGLNRSVREHSLTIPGEILDKTREIVVQEFEKSEEDVKDGMDIALCSIEGMKLQYAGAYNPLWIIRNGEIIETKANKQPIGQFDNPEPYTTHSFNLEKGDAIYIFSDGYVDQFGGEKEKKFKAKAFKKLLLSLQDKSMEEQKIVIDETFETWKGNLEQIDDVCVIGVRI
jgi:tetratricopeptide (TPR) repeat protein